MPDPDQLDRDLITATAAGDKAAFATLVARHQAAVHRIGRAITGSATEADDVTQDAFLGALRGAAGYHGPATVRAWLFAIARHAAYRRGRRANQVPHEPLEEREVVVLRDVLGLSGDEAAATLGVGLAAMKSRLHRGRLRLAGALRQGGGLDDR